MCRPIEAAQTYHGVVLELSHLFLPEDKLISEHLVHMHGIFWNQWMDMECIIHMTVQDGAFLLRRYCDVGFKKDY